MVEVEFAFVHINLSFCYCVLLCEPVNKRYIFLFMTHFRRPSASNGKLKVGNRWGWPRWPTGCPRRSQPQDTDCYWLRSAQVCPTRTKKCSAAQKTEKITRLVSSNLVTPCPHKSFLSRTVKEEGKERQWKVLERKLKCQDTFLRHRPTLRGHTSQIVYKQKTTTKRK